MKRINKQLPKLIAIILMITVGFAFNNDVKAQDEERGFMLSMGESTIKQGHNTAFREGVKAWKACYLENGGEWTWNIWRRWQGEGNVYVLTSRMDKWAEMDEGADEAGMKCRHLVRDMINPHIESSNSSLARFLPAWSKSSQSANNVIWVTYWRVENFSNFVEIAKTVGDAMQSAEGDKRGYWYRAIGGGPDSYDYFVVTPFENFAAMDVERDGVWTLVEKELGEEKKNEMQATWRDSVENAWSYIFTKQEDLSHQP